MLPSMWWNELVSFVPKPIGIYKNTFDQVYQEILQQTKGKSLDELSDKEVNKIEAWMRLHTKLFILEHQDKYPPKEILEYFSDNTSWAVRSNPETGGVILEVVPHTVSIKSLKQDSKKIFVNLLPIEHLLLIKKRMDDGMSWEEAVKDKFYEEYHRIKEAREKAYREYREEMKVWNKETKRNLMRVALAFFGELVPATLASMAIASAAMSAVYHNPHLLQPVYEHYLREVYAPQLAAAKTASIAGWIGAIGGWFATFFGLDEIYKRVLGMSALKDDTKQQEKKE